MALYYGFGADSLGQELSGIIKGIEVAAVAVPEVFAATWSPIRIDFVDIGIDATQVTSLTIGIRSTDAKGVVYIDNVMLAN